MDDQEFLGPALLALAGSRRSSQAWHPILLRSLSNQFGHDLRHRTGYLLSLCSIHALVALDRVTAQCPSRIGHMPGTPSFAFQTATAVQVAQLVQRGHHSAQQLLLSTVVFVVVTGTLCFFTVSLSFCCLHRFLGRGPLSTCRHFSCKGWATTPSYALSPYNVHGCITHRSLGVTYALMQVHPALSNSASDWLCHEQTA